MDTLHRLDDRLLVDVNDVARHSGRLHGAVAAGSWLASRALGAIAAVATVLMAFARVYVGSPLPVGRGRRAGLRGAGRAAGPTLLRVPLTTVTGWLRDRPGLRQTFPAPAAGQAGLREPRAAASVA
ncbi:MAG TPA: hypothetical protein VGO74_01975 [Modestobacter sp.]|jgi:hypothetical protein|nr:hypothetical protein [Modestobacter sp.]